MLTFGELREKVKLASGEKQVKVMKAGKSKKVDVVITQKGNKFAVYINGDKLDDSFIMLIKKRTILVKQVLKLKENKNQIIDNKRIKYILNLIKKKSIKNKIDPKITNRIWKNMIYSYIDFEKRNFRKK